jgi:hypothetical protein
LFDCLLSQGCFFVAVPLLVGCALRCGTETSMWNSSCVLNFWLESEHFLRGL